MDMVRTVDVFAAPVAPPIEAWSCRSFILIVYGSPVSMRLKNFRSYLNFLSFLISMILSILKPYIPFLTSSSVRRENILQTSATDGSPAITVLSSLDVFIISAGDMSSVTGRRNINGRRVIPYR